MHYTIYYEHEFEFVLLLYYNFIVVNFTVHTYLYKIVSGH